MADHLEDEPVGFLLGSSENDADDLAGLRCHVPPPTWYERDAAKVLRRAAQIHREGQLGERDRIFLFRLGNELLGVTIVTEEADSIGQLAFVGVRFDVRGATIGDSRERLSDAILATAIADAREQSFKQLTAEVGRDNEPSRALLLRAGFAVLSMIDGSYDLWAIKLR